jgi:hypothetical protein
LISECAPVDYAYSYGPALGVSGEIVTTSKDSLTHGMRQAITVRYYEALPDGV